MTKKPPSTPASEPASNPEPRPARNPAPRPALPRRTLGLHGDQQADDLGGPTDVDAVSSWRLWQPGTPGADAGRRGTRIMASAWTSVEPIAALYVQTATAVLVAGCETSAGDLVATQGHVMTVDTLLRTLAVEVTVHHLDLRLGKPSDVGLAETRRVLDGLLRPTRAHCRREPLCVDRHRP